MFKLVNNVNRSGKAGQVGGGSANIPFNEEYALATGEYVMFVADQGMLVEPDAVLQYGPPNSRKPIYAVFYTPREMLGRSLLCIDQIMVADSVQTMTIDGNAAYAVLGHTRAYYGTVAPVDPQCLVFKAKYEGIPAIMSRNSVLTPTYFLLKDGAPSGNMWTSPTFDMSKPAETAIGTITWSDGKFQTLPLPFLRGAVGPLQLQARWFPYLSTDIAQARYPIALSAAGTGIYWACWRPQSVAEAESVYFMQLEVFSQDTAESLGASVDNVAPLFMLGGV